MLLKNNTYMYDGKYDNHLLKKINIILFDKYIKKI